MGSRRDRWLPALRAAITDGSEVALPAARCLDELGSPEDVLKLRRFSKRRSADPDLGRALARRVAEAVFIEDQGRVVIMIGSRRIEGTSIRRKVLTMLCFLLTRPRFLINPRRGARRALAKFEPGVALNSLNQTIYFLRRVFEPSYREDVSPGYLRHESDVVWLDRKLVGSRSQLCSDYIRTLGPRPSPEEVAQLISMYRAQFALDFTYEEWAVAHRDMLHAAFLQIVESASPVYGNWRLGEGHRYCTARPCGRSRRRTNRSILGAPAPTQWSPRGSGRAVRSLLSRAQGGLGIEPPPLDAL